MATAPPQPPTRTSTSSKAIVSIAVLIAIVAFIVLSAIYVRSYSPVALRRLQEIQLQSHLFRTGEHASATQRRRRQDKVGSITPSLLSSLPVARFENNCGQEWAMGSDLEEGEEGGTLQEKSLEQEQTGNRSECCICMQIFKKDEYLRILPCEHLFHKHCIDPWLVRFSGICPVW
jgi:hypothetical protein